MFCFYPNFPRRTCDLAKTFLKMSQDKLIEDDEELAYVYLMRYFHLLKLIVTRSNTSRDNPYVAELLAEYSLILELIDLSVEMKTSLFQRYAFNETLFVSKTRYVYVVWLNFRYEERDRARNQSVAVGRNEIGFASGWSSSNMVRTLADVRNTSRIETESLLSEVLCSTYLDEGMTSRLQREQVGQHFEGVSFDASDASSLIDVTGRPGLQTIREAEELKRVEDEIRRLKQERMVRQANLAMRRQLKQNSGQEHQR